MAGNLTITGAHGSATPGGVPVDPFVGVTVTDVDGGATETLAISYEPIHGTLSDGPDYTGPRTLSGGGGSYRLTGTAAQVTQELDALSFTAPGLPDNYYFVDMHLSDQSTSGASATDDGTYVIVDEQPTAPPDAVSFSPQVFYREGKFMLLGTASSAAGVISVSISADLDGMPNNLGFVRLGPGDAFSNQDDSGVGSQTFITATEKDDAGDTASAQANYALTTGLDLPGGPRGAFTAEQDRYSVDGSAEIATTLFREDASQRVDVLAGGQTFESWQYDRFNNNGAPDTIFVFDPGHALDVVDLFRAGGVDHDTLSFAGSDFGDSVAELLSHTRDAKGGAVISDPTTGDTVKLIGVSKAQLRANQGDFSLHA